MTAVMPRMAILHDIISTRGAVTAPSLGFQESRGLVAWLPGVVLVVRWAGCMRGAWVKQGNPTWDFFWALNSCAADLDQPGLEQNPRPDPQTKPHHSCSLACRPVGARFGLVADMGGMRVEATEQGETGQGCRPSTGPRKPQVDSVWVAHREAQRERRLG